MMSGNRPWWPILSIFIFLSGCNQERNFGLMFSHLAQLPAPRESETIKENPLDFFCSKLDFSGLNFPDEFKLEDQIAYALALNITGSFEGNHGWATISNNFDGTGVSLGLLNQNLGSGTLQPMFISVRDHQLSIMQSTFGATRLSSLLSMLQTWENSPVSLGAESDEVFSLLDIQDGVSAMATRNQTSVNWAINNLYQSNNSFKPEWKSELTGLAVTAPYRELQVAVSSRYHVKAKNYFSSLGFEELRAYLFFFDIVVQNGGLHAENIADFKTYVSQNPNSTATQRLSKILELRLQRVNPQYKEVVRLRKQALIDGRGTVNQTRRELEREYCYDGKTFYN